MLSKIFQRYFQPIFVYKQRNLSSFPVGIIGAPFNKGQPKYGVDLAPDILRNYGLLKQLQALDLDIKDYGNVKFDVIDDQHKSEKGKLRYPLEVGAACQKTYTRHRLLMLGRIRDHLTAPSLPKVSTAVKNVLSEKRKCITIGGDHSLGIGTVHGHSLVHDVCVLWIDAHADINTPFTTDSGNMHGLPVAFLIRELQKYQSDVKGFEWLKPCVKKDNVAFIGLRDIDPLEKLILTKEKILHFTMSDIDKFGIFEVTQRALEAINPTGKLSLHVSFDIDAIDSTLTPSTGTPVLGGLTIREILCLAEEICHLECFRALDVVEVNPILGTKEQIENTLNVAILVIKAFLGYSRSGMLPLNIHEVPLS